MTEQTNRIDELNTQVAAITREILSTFCETGSSGRADYPKAEAVKGKEDALASLCGDIATLYEKTRKLEREACREYDLAHGLR